MRTLKVVLLLLVTIFSVNASIAQAYLSDKATISLLTCGAGNELYSVFGHTAVRINDPITGMDVVYNFGTFDFSTPNFYLKFVKGDLKYCLSISSYDDFVYTYQYYNRDVLEQFLNFSPTQKQQIATELNSILLSDKRYYTYKFIDRNCTTMVGDIFNKYIPGKISMKNADAGKTNRTIIYERLSNSFYENLGISLIFGYKTDKVMDRLFLPRQLLEGVSNTKLGGAPLAQPTVTVFKATPVKEVSLWNNFYTYTIACLLLMFFSRNVVVQRSILAIFGLLGIFFCTVGLYSFHAEICQNYNALLVNPLFLLIVVFIFARKTKAAQLTTFVSLGCIAVYFIFMLNKPHIFIMLPLIALIVVTLLRVLATIRKNNTAGAY